MAKYFIPLFVGWLSHVDPRPTAHLFFDGILDLLGDPDGLPDLVLIVEIDEDNRHNGDDHKNQDDQQIGPDFFHFGAGSKKKHEHEHQ